MYSLIIVILVIAAVSLFMQQPEFGKLPSGERLERIKKSPNYRDGQFQNLLPTPNLTEGANFFGVLYEFIFRKSKRSKPKDRMPSQKTGLHGLSPDENVLVWFGHSSYFMQLDGKKILVDPVFSGNASPIPGTTRSFPGSDVYTTDAIPEIDYLFISHDHWDHLDYDTVTALKPKIKTIITGLGTGAHLEHWGFDTETIIERDWNETISLDTGFKAHTTPARHFSGRTFKRNHALWLSFVLETPTKKIFIGGDSGFGPHLTKIGTDFGPFDLALVECGQYDKNWRYIHLLPEEMLPAATALQTKVLMPVHWGKFSLGNHDWDEPIRKVSEAAERENFPLLTPMIGQKVNLNALPISEKWWTTID